MKVKELNNKINIILFFLNDILFDNGRILLAHDGHLWSVYVNNESELKTLSTQEIKEGLNKGNIYKIIALAKHSETTEDMIVYQSVEHGDIWVRPKSMWNEIVDEKGTLRFTLC